MTTTNAAQITTVALLLGGACSCGRKVPEPFRLANKGRTITCSACKSKWKIPTDAESALPAPAYVASGTVDYTGATISSVLLTPAAPPPEIAAALVQVEEITQSKVEDVKDKLAMSPPPPVTETPAPPAPAPVAAEPAIAATPLPPEVEKNATKLLNSQCVVIQTSYPIPGDERKVGKSEGRFEASGEGGAPDQKRIRVLKSLWDCPEYNAILTHDGQTQRRIDRYALPQSEIIRKGSRVVLLTDVEKIVNQLEEDAKVRLEKIDAFVKVYPALIEKAKLPEKDGGLGALFRESDFYKPGFEIRSRFLTSNDKPIYRRLRMATDGAPAGLGVVSEELLRKELEEAQREGVGMLTQVRDGLRYAFAELVAGLSEKLKTPVGEPAKGLKETNVKKLQEFIDGFLAVGQASRNVAQDDTLKALAERAKAILTGVDIESVRKKTNVKVAFETAVDTIKGEMDKLVTVTVKKPNRKYGSGE